jgi:uncharacterized membrane protein
MKKHYSDLEVRMQRLSFVTSVLGFGLMILGFADMLFLGASLSIPGTAALSIPMIRSGTHIPVSLLTMSAGIVVLALLPVLRVLYALSLYLHGRQILNVVVAFLVFIELLVSVRTGG